MGCCPFLFGLSQSITVVCFMSFLPLEELRPLSNRSKQGPEFPFDNLALLRTVEPYLKSILALQSNQLSLHVFLKLSTLRS